PEDHGNPVLRGRPLGEGYRPRARRHGRDREVAPLPGAPDVEAPVGERLFENHVQGAVMSDLDSRIRGALAGLRQASVPDVPKIRAARPEPRTAPPALIVAAAMLVLLAVGLTFVPSRPPATETVLSERITSLETRIAKIDHPELRSLLGRELALLRRELEL